MHAVTPEFFLQKGLGELYMRSLLGATAGEFLQQSLSPTNGRLLAAALFLQQQATQLDAAESRAILDSVKPHLSLTPCLLVLLDGVFFTHSGKNGFQSLRDGSSVDMLAVAPATTITYNLTEIANRTFANNAEG